MTMKQRTAPERSFLLALRRSPLPPPSRTALPSGGGALVACLGCPRPHAAHAPPVPPCALVRMPRYWAVVGHSHSTDLDLATVMLKNRFSVMGPVESSHETVAERVQHHRVLTYAILVAVTLCSLAAPTALGLWLGMRLVRLAAAMDDIVSLRFGAAEEAPTVFSELHHFQRSFAQMQNGLQAFSAFVPSAVVKVLVAGYMHTDDRMTQSLLTIMFADIQGFSTISERLCTERLVEVCGGGGGGGQKGGGGRVGGGV